MPLKHKCCPEALGVYTAAVFETPRITVFFGHHRSIFMAVLGLIQLCTTKVNNAHKP